MTIVADSGSTKTAWCIIPDKGGDTPFLYASTQGINPYQQSEEDICALLRHELVPQLPGTEAHSIHFYGAGCTPDKAPVVAAALRKTVSATARISVDSDMLGAARAVCGSSRGVVCILGTGSNSCRYDGRTLEAGIPALGYILGDEGSGAYIGKRLVGDVLKRQLPDDVCTLFFDETHATQATIIQRVYREPMANRYLASLSPFCARHREMPPVHDLLIDCFVQFFKRNLHPLEHYTDTVHFVGSIAFYYEPELREAARMCGYTVGNIVQAPLDGLVKYHSQR